MRKEEPPEAIQFGGAFKRLLHQIVTADPDFGPVFMLNIDMSDAYMRVWIRLEDVPKLASVVPPHTDDAEPLIGLHLPLPMGYVESAQYFCTTAETVVDLVNGDWVSTATAPPTPSTETQNPRRRIVTVARASHPSYWKRK